MSLKISDCFPSPYLKASDLQPNKDIEVEIESVTLEEMEQGGESRPVVRFAKKKKRFVLNRTNSQTLAEAFGDETMEWVGRKILLFVSSTTFNGRPVQCIRCRPSQPAARPDVFDEGHTPF